MIDEWKLIREILPSCSGIRLVPVRKQRFLYLVGSCRVEYGEVRIADLAMQTVAIEHETAEKVLQVRELLGLATKKNTNYQRKLKQIMDRDPSIR